MTERNVERPADPWARTTGVVYLLYFLTAIVGGLLTKGLVVPGDATATANGILAHATLYRSGLAVDVLRTHSTSR